MFFVGQTNGMAVQHRTIAPVCMFFSAVAIHVRMDSPRTILTAMPTVWVVVVAGEEREGGRVGRAYDDSTVCIVVPVFKIYRYIMYVMYGSGNV